MTVYLSDAEREAIEALAEALHGHVPGPGTRCPICHHRFNKKPRPSSPEARKVDGGRLPLDRANQADDNLDSLQEYVGADRTSYARGDLYEKLVVLGIQKREELKALYEGTE